MCRIAPRINRPASGFTLVELLCAIAILSAVTVITYMTFATVTTAWRRGMALTDQLHHGDFLIEQLSMALRSMYFPNVSGGAALYGFTLEDHGDSERSSDEISWVKLGDSLVGSGCPFAGSPHRVRFSIEDAERGGRSVHVRAWRVEGQPEDFDPADVEPLRLSERFTGFNCRVAHEKLDDEIDWLDEWKDTNRCPTVVEITLYMAPLEEGGRPVEVKRVVGVPIAPLSWR